MKGISVNCYVNIDYNFNIFILYRKHESVNKRPLEGYYFDDFVQVMILKIKHLMHFCHKLVTYMQLVIYP